MGTWPDQANQSPLGEALVRALRNADDGGSVGGWVGGWVGGLGRGAAGSEPRGHVAPRHCLPRASGWRSLCIFHVRDCQLRGSEMVLFNDSSAVFAPSWDRSATKSGTSSALAPQWRADSTPCRLAGREVACVRSTLGLGLISLALEELLISGIMCPSPLLFFITTFRLLW